MRSIIKHSTSHLNAKVTLISLFARKVNYGSQSLPTLIMCTDTPTMHIDGSLSRQFIETMSIHAFRQYIEDNTCLF